MYLITKAGEETGTVAGNTTRPSVVIAAGALTARRPHLAMASMIVGTVTGIGTQGEWTATDNGTRTTEAAGMRGIGGAGKRAARSGSRNGTTGTTGGMTSGGTGAGGTTDGRIRPAFSSLQLQTYSTWPKMLLVITDYEVGATTRTRTMR